ncbi:rhodanese-related sulfurtransferase [Aerococcaceae bacterium NML191292]|nr:rhodanese-related sulfurtransferase [Aerococcaceae bacterium NML210727]MCW6654286.1 rhodanese-related sulfurtransferase [Aerococcaceae bacterium NML201296]MCW6660173.1 rhodanese-related sulfurtransferase [Aerococcaceae bacterium NML191292]MCW6661061.1 rhodanese-related sulfurtransferase [Aerococcaceae bacterium NML201209]MCW6663549.1 rhodanese-related sulfurtransferase [Aerococcaceae bacterium NML190073]MCW6664119.1 rhodanese-related sulfurtransferase [Aerococcaceae bacterium NML191219]MCW
MTKPYRVLLYYKYTTIENPEAFAAEHLAKCKEIGLKGRILVATEGINGTVSGTVEQTEAYKNYVHSLPGFEDLWFKEDEEDTCAFRKMFVRPRPALLNIPYGEEDINPLELTGEYLDPKQFKEALLDENTVVLDTRNDYEYDLGHFRGAIRPDIRSFRELPQWVRDNKELFMEKRVVVYCTGGIRCEKFSGWLLREGFKDVGQLHGGIATYGKDPEVRGELWDGKMYVFDDRIAVEINQVDKQIVGKDIFDGSPCERTVNCGNPFCNKQVIMSEENEAKYLRGCTAECRRNHANRYVAENHLTTEEWEARLNALGESLSDEVTA